MKSLSAQGTPSVLKAEWDSITVEYSCLPPGEFDVSIAKNIVGIAFSPQDCVTWRVDGGSRRTTPLPPGSAFLYSSSEFVWSRWKQPSECLHIALAPDLLSRVAADCSLTHIDLDYRVMFTDPTILHIGHLLKAEIHTGGLAGKLYMESLTNILAVHLLREYSGLVVKPELEGGPLGNLKLNHVFDFIEARLAEDLTIASMAGVVHMSPFHFARAFKAATGQPPHRYVTHRRMERAKGLLSVTRLPVAEVAYRVGFSNKSHFIAQFRRATGTTPQVYRNGL